MMPNKENSDDISLPKPTVIDTQETPNIETDYPLHRIIPGYRIIVRVGPGAWKATFEGVFAAPPHVGEFLVIGDEVITCEKIFILKDEIIVESPHHYIDYYAYQRILSIPGWK